MLKSRIPQIIIEIALVADEIEEDGAELVTADAKARVPVRSGTLRDKIHAEKETEGTYVVAGDDDVWYGHLVEHGTSHSAPRPFLVPALEENRGEIVNRGAARLRRL
jgi:HK97 gp10 family phage protein